MSMFLLYITEFYDYVGGAFSGKVDLISVGENCVHGFLKDFLGREVYSAGLVYYRVCSF